MAQVVIPVIDYGNEKSSVTLNVADAILDATITTLYGAVDGLTIGTLEKSMLKTSADKDAGSTTPPVNQYAQREIKWLVKYSDDVTGKRYSLEIPCADLSLLVAGTETMNVAAGAGAAFVTAFEANVLSPDGNAVSFISAKMVGRNF